MYQVDASAVLYWHHCFFADCLQRCGIRCIISAVHLTCKLAETVEEAVNVLVLLASSTYQFQSLDSSKLARQQRHTVRADCPVCSTLCYCHTCTAGVNELSLIDKPVHSLFIMLAHYRQVIFYTICCSGAMIQQGCLWVQRLLYDALST